MREIKVRWVGRNVKFDEIYISDPITTSDILIGSYPSFFSLSNRFDAKENKDGNCIFIAECSYTGLKDKNGKEIYEGDVIEWDKGEYTIIFSDFTGGWICKDDRDDFDCPELMMVYRSNAIEILGNIYENNQTPNLLTNTDEHKGE